jgi:hypothetical protein
VSNGSAGSTSVEPVGGAFQSSIDPLARRKGMRNNQRRVVLALVAVLALGLTAAAAAGELKAQKTAVRAAGNGMQVAIDPATGKIRQPTAEEMRSLAAALGTNKSLANLQMKEYADGTLSVTLDESFLNVWVARIGADGTLSQVCVPASEADAAMNGSTPALEEK